jgi:succinyl-CoA:acetate CoA-transferase
LDANFAGQNFRIGVWTGASTAPELDGALAMVGGIDLRLPYQSDPVSRKRINSGEMEYVDMHFETRLLRLRMRFPSVLPDIC